MFNKWVSLQNWRIQNQILLPIILATAIGILLSTYFNIRGLIQNENQRVQTQVKQLFETLAQTSFPLTRSVLVQVEQISGIHLLVSQQGVADSSFSDANGQPLNSQPLDTSSENQGYSTAPGATVRVEGRDFSIDKYEIPSRDLQILAFYPTDQLYAAINKVVYPQVISGTLTLAVVGLLVVLVSRNVTIPIQQLKQHVLRIADGNFSANHLVRQDEIGQLFQSVNEMAEKLQLYEKRIRAQEKLLTLDQMGGGIAHQMKNSITGCRLALDLHRQKCQSDPESLDVAIRQLTFMEDFQKKFLSLTKEKNDVHQPIDVADVVQQYTKLLEPFARHVQVEFDVEVTDYPLRVTGNESMIRQLVGNLVINAIEAASTHHETQTKKVLVKVHDEKGLPTITVIDSGSGISPGIATQIFEPLVTSKPDGVGLGLAIVKQTVEQHGATIDWQRENEMTRFTVVFPAGNKHVEMD